MKKYIETQSMENSLEKLGEHKYKYQTGKMKIPVVFHASEKLLPNEDTFQQLENLAADKRLFHHIAAMSDVHPKIGRKNPTGTVIASEDYILPQINDTAPNCGMRMIKTNLDEKNFSLDKIFELFEMLVRTVPTKKYTGLTVSKSLAYDICRKGIEPLVEFLESRTKNEISNAYRNGNFFDGDIPSSREIRDCIPDLFIEVARRRMGILGAAGNHFLDLMKVTDLIDQNICNQFGIYSGQYVFLMHTGSGLLGQYASYMYTPKIKEHFSQKVMLKIGTGLFRSQMKKIYAQISRSVKKYRDREEFIGYDSEELAGKMMIRAHRASANFGFANRTAITHAVDQSLEQICGNKVELDMLYDTPHVFIDKENHFGKDLWIHRNGAVRAYGPERMTSHQLFSKTGEPVCIPSSMSTAAYLGVGTDSNESGYFSAGHGTGRRREAGKEVPKNKKELFNQLQKSQVRLFNAKSKGVMMQGSGYYKDVDEVMRGMESNQIIKIAAKMQPVAVLMY
jgi:tRNA-splicing ligase RtcB (3'-phosphate/5'-hydroxy nucleic acid ligase)